MNRWLKVFVAVTSAASAALLWPVLADGPAAPVSRPAPVVASLLPPPAPVRTPASASAPVPATTAPVAAPPPRTRQQAQDLADRERLGPLAHDELLRRWDQARRAVRHGEAARLFGGIVRQHPDTHRADCARLEMGRRLLLDGNRTARERRDAAGPVLSALAAGIRDSRCGADASAAHLAAYALADQVYRHDAPGKAHALLRRLSRLPPAQTNGEGQPLARLAQDLAERLWAEEDAPDDEDDLELPALPVPLP